MSPFVPYPAGFKLNDPTIEQREARANERRRERLAATAAGHLCVQVDAAGHRIMRSGFSGVCRECEDARIAGEEQ